MSCTGCTHRDVMPRSLVEVNRRFGGIQYLHILDRRAGPASLLGFLVDPEGGGIMFVRNAANFNRY